MNNIDKVYCINMAHRTDRWEHCLKNFEKLNCTNYQRIEGQLLQYSFFDKKENARLGLVRSVVNCFKDCVKNDYNNIIIFEDDFTPTENFNFEHLSKTIDSVYLTNDWDLLYLGYRNKGSVVKYNDNLNRIYGAYTAHAILYNRKYIDELLKDLPDEDWGNEDIKRWHNDYKVIDVYLSIKSNHRTYYCGNINFFTQIPSYSDIESDMRDYLKLIR